MPNPLEFVPLDDLLSEVARRTDSFIAVFRQDKAEGWTATPEIARSGSIWDNLGLLIHAQTRILDDSLRADEEEEDE